MKILASRCLIAYPGAIGARIGIQDHHGHGDARGRRRRQKIHRVLPGLRVFLWTDAQIGWVYGKRATRGESAIPRLCILRRVFLQCRPAHGDRHNCQIRQDAGPGSKTGIDMPSRIRPGPSEDWVQRVYHHKWYPGSTIRFPRAGFGDGHATAGAYVIGGIVSGGNSSNHTCLKMRRMWARSTWNSRKHRRASHARNVRLINEAGGTGNSVKLQGIEFCGKSGTAADDELQRGQPPGLGKGKNDGWFVGFLRRGAIRRLWCAVVEDTSSTWYSGDLWCAIS